MKEVFISVVIPCFDEMANLQKGVLNKVAHFLESKDYSYEVIVVDDGSRDGSLEFIESFISKNSNFKLIKNPHFGKAGAVTTGMLEGRGKYRLFTDMDQATPIEELDKLLPYLENQKFDIAIGSRKDSRKGSPIVRILVSRAAVILRKLMIGLPDISDTQCGFKLFTGKATDDLFSKFKKIKNGFSQTSGAAITFGFDIEILYLAEKKGYKITEAPVNWLFVESRRVSPIRDSIQGVIDLIKIKNNIVSGKYD